MEVYFHILHAVFASTVAGGGGGGRLEGSGGGGDGPPAPRLLEVGQEAKFYMVDDDPPSMLGMGSGGGCLTVCIVRLLPWRSVILERAVGCG